MKDTKVTHQVHNTGRGSFVLSTFGEEQKALAGLVSPCGIRMGNFGLLGTKIAVKAVCLECLVAEPEEPL